LTKTKTLVLDAKLIKDYTKRFRSTGAFYNSSAFHLKMLEVRIKRHPNNRKTQKFRQYPLLVREIPPLVLFQNNNFLKVCGSASNRNKFKLRHENMLI